ncbi:tyrosine-type recombinase/integrase [Phenylobacterium soli]|nr:site-specific integrase [Phenylobacterium soli]
MPDFSLVKIRTSPNWYVQWFEGGRSHRVSTRTRSDDEAQAFLAAFRLAGADEPLDDLTVTQLLDWYWDAHGKTVMRPDNISLAIRYLKPFFGSTSALGLTLEMQEAYRDHRRGLKAGDESIRRDLSVLSAALKRAVKRKKLAHCPPILSMTPAPPRERWLTRGEVARLLWRMRGKRQAHVRLFTRLALYTGARTGAILDLTWDRVNFETGLIDFRVPGRPQTKKRRTVAPMTRKVRRMLLHAKKHSRSRYVVSWAGEKIDRVAKACITHAEAAGIKDFSPHILRHTFASWAVQRRVPIFTVGKALGQTVASTTERYAKLAPDDVLEAMERAQRK